MRGFLVGTFALVVLSAFLQKGAAKNLTSGTSAAAAAFARLTDPNVAGVPLRAGVAGKQAGPRPAPKQGPDGIQGPYVPGKIA